MRLNKLFNMFGKFMTQKNQKVDKRAALDNLLVKLSPHKDESNKSASRKKSVQLIISMMISDLHRRGRPKKDEEGDSSHAA